MDFLSSTERIKYGMLLELLTEYERSNGSDCVFDKIILACPGIDRSYLNDYWKSSSIEEVCLQYCCDCAGDLNDEACWHAINEALSAKGNVDQMDKLLFIIYKYGRSIEAKFGCSDGMFLDVIMRDDMDEYDLVVAELKRNGPIRL